MTSDWPTVAVRLALYAVLATLFGLSAFSLYGLRAGERADAVALRPWLVATACLALVSSIIALLLMASNMAGAPLWPVDQEAVSALLDGSAIGTAWKIRVVALAVAGVAAMLARGRAAWLSIVMAASALAIATMAWTGHGAMDEGTIGWVHLGADILHLVAAGVWVGALVGLVLLVARPVSRLDAAHLTLTHRALHGFGAIGTIVVGTIVVTGLVNTWLLVGFANVPHLTATLYGQLLIAKLILFAAMLGLASLNRFKLTPAFERSVAADDYAAALGMLRRSLAVETTCVFLILGLVAWLGTLAPPASAM